MAERGLHAVWRWARSRPSGMVFAVALLFAATVDRQVPWTDDARFYVPAAAAYGTWLAEVGAGLVRLDLTPLERPRRDRAFRVNQEHPPVAKYVMAAGWLLFHRATGLSDEVTACRTGVWLLWAWMIALVFGVLHRWRGWAAAIFGAAGLALMPRLLFHGQVETLDLPVTAFVLAASLATFDALDSPGWRPTALAVALFGLALGCKLNAPFLLVAAVLYWLLVSPMRFDRVGLRLPAVPLLFGAMALFSPLIVVGLWPWLWSDTLARLSAYVAFHLHHYGILFYFGGTLYGEQVAPWYAALCMTALTVPLPLLFFATAGALGAAQAAGLHLSAVWRRLAPHSRLDYRAPHVRLGVFALLQAAVQLVAVSLPGVPSYGGVKLFLPVFPFLAILAGLAFAHLVDELARTAYAPRIRKILIGTTIVLLLLPGALGVLGYRGAWLSYYNELAGGVRGATAAGFERQYYDLAYPELADLLARHLPNGGRVAVLPNPKEYEPYLARWQDLGRLPGGIRRVPPEQADLLLLTHERRWRDYALLLARYRTRPVLAERAEHDVPLYTLYDLRGAP